MLGSLDSLLAATVLFVASHLLLSSAGLRASLVKQLGDQGFRVLYSAVALVTFLWMIFAYGDAAVIPVWYPPLWSAWIPILVMPVSLFLIVAGATTPSPTMMGGEARLDGAAPGNPMPGILRITRHPVMCGITLWALAHLAANGTGADIILMGGVAALAVVGMRHIDQRREAALGSAWGPIAMTTSLVPFAAIASGRTSMDWPGIGWWRPALALAIYVVLIWLHEPLMGVPVWPA